MIESKFSRDELDTIHHYFPTSGDSDKHLTFNRLTGFLTAIDCSPTIIPPSAWWRALKELPELEINSEQDEQKLQPLLYKLNSEIASSLVFKSSVLPKSVELVDYPYGTAPVEHWCRGFMDGMLISEDAWFDVKDENAVENLEVGLGVIALLASREEVTSETEEENVDERMEKAQEFLPEVVEHLHAMGQSDLYAHLRSEDFEGEPELNPVEQPN
ncbi:hypothetical protein BOW53_07770 [Solemya pervernicosa gill symbiont]|uniref:YecA family protein n=2 Tax=Gammaproteobacteria incertae sedis TaxID=118884 RepID=A0A1T2L5U6_9GAMM|nr:YecA family protein [Candidatus Reidiella endopervernicosa]OOZ40459.1 hypothetical protein BOW53_07770 [Solemya pervernicosa gill symbiont]QKQ25377.1 YecA family protein [Candidatus Reidiella endopervernicosa]